MRVRRLVGWMAVVLGLSGCQSQEKQAEEAAQTARSWIAGIHLTCTEWRAGHVPRQFAERAVGEARKELQKTAAQLPVAERARTLAAAGAADCFSGPGKQP